VPAALSTFERKAAVRRADGWMKAGAPKDVAHAVAVIRPLTLAAPLADLAQAQAWPLAPTAFVYHKVGGAFGFDKLRAAASTRGGDDPFERLAVRRLIEDMIVQQTALAGQTMAFAGGPPREGEAERAVAAVTAWTSAHTQRVKAARRTIDDVEKAPGGWTFAKLTIANGALRELAGG
jgi:glutamate dehydrogenase